MRAEGGNEKAIILAHVWRIILVIAAIAFWFRLIIGFEVDGILSQSETPTGPMDLLIHGVSAVVGSAIRAGAKATRAHFYWPD